MMNLTNCNICPRKCGINRYSSKGFCGANSKIKVAHYGIHKWEEPIISGINGSGTVFFSNCNLKCIFCQNRKISMNGYGTEISARRLGEIFLELQSKGCHNINLVTPTMYVPQIVGVLHKIKGNDLKIPVVYNTSSYENCETIKYLKNSVDIYLADLKYYDNNLGIKYSNCERYFEVASLAINEMYRQVGKFIIKDNILVKGLVVRILVLPGHIEDSKNIIAYLFNKYGDNIIISIMNQYTPVNKCEKYNNLNRCLTDDEYNEVVEYACDIGVTYAFIQEGTTQLDSFIPEFNCEIV